MSARMTTLQLWKRALGHGAQWRYLLLFPAVMLLPVGLSFAPTKHYLAWLFDHSTREPDLVARLDSAALTDVLKQLGEADAAGIFHGTHAAIVVALILAPALAGAAAALARHPTAHLRLRGLLGGSGEMYPRMLRMALVAVLPLGIAAGIGALAFHFASKSGEHATMESSADAANRWATIVTLLFVWLASVTVEAGRAHLAAQPDRRSAFVAWWAGVKLLVKRPGQALGLCAMTSVLGVGVALAVTALRNRIVEGGAGTILLGFLLGQLAIVAIAWGRSSRLVGLVELVRESKG
jgi:hypothetical protein